MTATEYPRLKQIGIEVRENPVAYVTWTDLDAKLADANIDRKKFGEMFGIQTMYVSGPYAWDVEAVLERMFSGRLTGSQRHWD
jgi:hypothetical protein